MSDDVFRQIQGRVAGDFVDIGEQQLRRELGFLVVFATATAAALAFELNLTAHQLCDHFPV
jgi:hypothetical protein